MEQTNNIEENKSPYVPEEKKVTPQVSLKSSSKLIPILLIILIFAVLGVGALYAYGNYFRKETPIVNPNTNKPITISPTDPTSNWKTYTKSGISLKYPNDWLSEEFTIDGGEEVHGVASFKPMNYRLDFSALPLQISYWENPKNLSVEDYHNEINRSRQMIYPLYDKSAETALIGNNRGYLSHNADCQPFVCDRYVIPFKGKIWEILVDPGQYKEVALQIISTVKFTY